MKISHHLYAGAAAGTLIYIVSDQNLPLTVSFIAANSMIDLDHFVDFWHDHRKLFNIKGLVRASYSGNYRHFIVPLHSYEILILFVILYTLGLRSLIFVGIALGFTLHLLMDQAQAEFNSKTLFLLYRVKNKFIFEKIVDPQKLALKRRRIEPNESILT